MATILVVTSGLPSLVYSSIELARRLAAADHRVVFAGLADAREFAETHRLEFLPLEPSRYERFLEADARAGTLRRLLRLRRRRERAREALAVAGFARAVGELRPDLVLVNGEMHEQIIAALGAGARVVLLNTFVSIWRRPGLPPPHCRVRPGVGWAGSRLGIRLLWLASRLRKWGRAWVRRIRCLGCDRPAILRALARANGIEPRRLTDAGEWLIPFTYRHLPVLSLHALEFEFPHRPPQRVRYVGPMVLDARGDRQLSAPDRERLAAILSRSRRAGGRRTLIFAGFGSVLSTDLALLRRLPEIVRERPDWELVISLSGRSATAEIASPAERVHLFSWLPQLELLERADVMIAHGGIGTVDECVLHGVPLLIYRGGETDMAGTTARVEHHGLGVAGDRRDSVPVIRGRIDRLLREPGFRESLRRLRPLYKAYAAERVAERAVEELLVAAPGGRDS